MTLLNGQQQRRAAADPVRSGFEECYAAHFRGITLQINAYVGDLAEAQDLVQEAFARAFARWSRLERYEDPAAWIRRVTWNLATSRWRRQRTASAATIKLHVRLDETEAAADIAGGGVTDAEGANCSYVQLQVDQVDAGSKTGLGKVVFD